MYDDNKQNSMVEEFAGFYARASDALSSQPQDIEAFKSTIKDVVEWGKRDDNSPRQFNKLNYLRISSMGGAIFDAAVELGLENMFDETEE